MAFSPAEIASLRIALRRVAFFEHLKMEELDLLIGALVPQPFQAGEVIIKEGEPGRAFYLIADGTLAITRRRFFRTRQIAVRKTGEFVGEMALLEDKPRNATVTGDVPGKLYALSRDAFDGLMRGNPAIAAMVRRTADARSAEDRALEG